MNFSIFGKGKIDAESANAVLSALERLDRPSTIKEIEDEVLRKGDIQPPPGSNPRYLYLKIHKTIGHLEDRNLVVCEKGLFMTRPLAVERAVQMEVDSAEQTILKTLSGFATQRLTPSDIDRLRAALDGALGAESPRDLPKKRLPFSSKKK